MTDIFISYSRKDVELASTLAQTLKELGYSVWWDMSGLHGGQAFAQVIQQKLGEAKCAIVVWSPDSVKSNWVHSEASFADNRGILLTAVYREAYAPMPFNNRHNENLRGWNGNVFDEDFQKLLKSVHRLCSVPSGAPRSVETPPDNSVEKKHEPTVNVQNTPPVQTVAELQPKTKVAVANENPPSENVAKPQIKSTVKPAQNKRAESSAPKSGITTGTKAVGVGALVVSIATGAYFLNQPKPDTSTSGAKTAEQANSQQVADASPPAAEQTATNTQASVPVPLEQVSIKSQPDDTSVTKKLIENAKQALAGNRLTIPANNNVLFFAREILKANPENQEARSLLTQACSRYHDLAESKITGEDYDKAEAYLNKSQQIIIEFALTQLQPTQDKIEAQLKSELDAVAKAKAEKAASSKVYKLANNLTLLPMPAGSFMMGSNPGASDEKPIHKVTFDKPFWMSKTEVTFDQYDAYAKAAGKSLPDDSKWGRGTRPVIYVSWNDAQAYTKWLSANNGEGLQCRLPSESEWEYAARAGSTTKYFWGDVIGKNKANCRDCGSQWDKKKTAAVGSFPANQWGLQDMHGNVWEWVQDPWHKDYNGAPNNGEVWYKNGDDSSRVLRGGSWDYAPRDLRSAYRSFVTPGYRLLNVGFRVVCSPQSAR